ncbi:MAG: TonB-dependent receptor, partial [Hydrogenovibrio sp.]|nr:TonB-dependent receptor [Hydrogenovibrio sp.]
MQTYLQTYWRLAGRQPRVSFLSLGILSLCASPAVADPAAAKTRLDTVVVEDSRESKSKIAVGASTRLTVAPSEQQRNATASLGALMENLPGVDNQKTGAQAGRPVVRGMTGERLKILSNGLSTDYQAYGVRHQANIEPAFADRIEVVRGAEALKYSGASAAGVVNIDSMTIPYGQPEPSAEILGEYNTNNAEPMVGAKLRGSFGKFGAVLGVTKRKGEAFVSPSGPTAGTVTPSDPPGTLPLVTGTTPYTDFESGAGLIGLGYSDDWGTVEVKHAIWETWQNFLGVEAASTTSPYELMPAAGQHLKNVETQLKAELFSDAGWVFKPAYAHTRNQRIAVHDDVYQNLANYSNDPALLDLVVHRDELTLGIEHPEYYGWQGEFGISGFDKQQDLRSGDLAPSATENGQSVYWVDKKRTGRWEWDVGGRYHQQAVTAPLSTENTHFWNDLNIYDSTNNHRSFGGWSGALGAGYRLTPQWKLSTQLTRSFRAPTIYELYAGGMHGGVQAYEIGNPNLNPETGTNVELALGWQSEKLKMNASVYQNWMENYIALENTGYYRYGEGDVLEGQQTTTAIPGRTLPEMQNQQTAALLRGVEFYADYRQTPRLNWTLTGEWIEGIDQRNHRDLPLMPANHLKLQSRYDISPWLDGKMPQQTYLGLGVKYTAAK